MSRPTYDVLDEYTGAGNLDEYSFGFKIEDSDDLLVLVLDDEGNEHERVRGSDTTTFVSSIEFDEIEGGGTVTLLANLPTDYTLFLILDPTEPIQPSEFKEKGSFTLRSFEMALDRLCGAIQRLTWLIGRVPRLHDGFDATGWDSQLPITVTAGYYLGINEDATGFDLIEPNAEITGETEHSLTDGQAATDLDDETVDSADYTSKVYHYEIIRGTTVFSTGHFALHYRNSTWYVVMGEDRRDGSAAAHGVTLSVSGTTTAQLRAACDSGAGNGTIKLKKFSFTA